VWQIQRHTWGALVEPKNPHTFSSAPTDHGAGPVDHIQLPDEGNTEPGLPWAHKGKTPEPTFPGEHPLYPQVSEAIRRADLATDRVDGLVTWLSVVTVIVAGQVAAIGVLAAVLGFLLVSFAHG
jgi:hypothetical protein